MKPGDTVLYDFPGSPLHGKAVVITEILPEFNIAAEDAPPLLTELIMVNHPSLPRPVGTSRARIAGTVENVRCRALEREEADDRQEELPL